MTRKGMKSMWTYIIALMIAAEAGTAEQTDRPAEVPTAATVTIQAHARGIADLAYSPTRNMLASCSAWDKTIKLWDAESRQLLATLEGHDKAVLRVAFSPDGRTLVSAGTDEKILFWDVATRKALHRLEFGSLFPGGVYNCGVALRISPDGRLLAIRGGDRRSIKVWNMATRKQEAVIETGGSKGRNPTTLDFSPDGTSVAFATYWGRKRRGGFLVLWHVEQGRELWSQEKDSGAVTSLAFSPDGSLLATGNAGCTVCFRDAQTGRVLGKSKARHVRQVYEVAFSPDGRILASSAAYGPINVTSVTSYKKLGELMAPYGDGARTRCARSPVFLGDGTRLAARGPDGTIRICGVGVKEQDVVDDSDEPVDFRDRTLKRAVASHLRKSLIETDDPTPEEMIHLKTLTLRGSEIRDFEGLQFAVNLESVTVRDSGPSAQCLAALAALPCLKKLRLYDVDSGDIAVLASMSRLEALFLSSRDRKLQDISAFASLSGLPRLKTLHLCDHLISDVSPLAGLTNLVTLKLNSNRITDISPLKTLPHLRQVNLHDNQVKDIPCIGGSHKYILSHTPVQMKYLAIQLGVVLALAIAMTAIIAVQDWKKSQRVYLLPTLALLLAVASPVPFHAYGFLCRNLIPRPHNYQPALTVTSSLALAGVLLGIAGLVHSFATGTRTGRKRCWAAIISGIVLGGFVWLCHLASEFARNCA